MPLTRHAVGRQLLRTFQPAPQHGDHVIPQRQVVGQGRHLLVHLQAEVLNLQGEMGDKGSGHVGVPDMGSSLGNRAFGNIPCNH
jgi:hypothetical protein